MTQPNIPLLRKAVEWAESEAAKPKNECMWLQQWWVTTSNDDEKIYEKGLRDSRGITCGTTYCIAGYITEVLLGEVLPLSEIPYAAAKALGISYDAFDDANLSDGNRLFSANNTIERVRMIAEEIAGERL